MTLLSWIKGFIAGAGSGVVELMCQLNSGGLKVRRSLKILQDITKPQVTNLSLPGDTERITAANLCWTVPVFRRGWGGKDSLFITQQVQPILFPLSLLCASQTRPELKPTSPDSVIYSQGTNLHSQVLSESLYQLGVTVFIITYIIVEPGLVIVLRCASQERGRDEINDQRVRPQLDRLLD